VSEELPERQRNDLPTRTFVAARGLAAGARLGGRYRILEVLGIGGMGMVYQAEDEQLGLTIAVKILRPDLVEGEELRERFKQELLLARQVSHPNVVRIHDIGNDGDLVFLTMDFVPGRSLRELLAEEQRLPPERAIEIARQLALALGAAHQAGVVHRDLKPGNVLVDESGGALRAAITDFGVARSLSGSRRTQPGTVLGTLGYLSPEQARGEAVDGRSDLYALGLLLYEMLTGELPFSAATEAEMLAQRWSGATPDLRWADGRVPKPLRSLIERLLAHDPARRPADAAEVVRELDRVGATPPAFRVGARRRAKVAAGLLALLVLAALLGVGWTVHRRARQPPPRKVAAPAGSSSAGSARHAVALLPLADETGRPDLAWVATGVPEMLATSLAENPELRILDSQRVFSTLDDLKLPRGSMTDAEERRLARLLDADRLVGGRVRAAGGQLRIDLSLVANEPSGAPPAEIHAEAPIAEAFHLVEELGSTLRQNLAVPAVEVASVARRAPAVLASYSEGTASLLRGDALAAVPALERAVAADPHYSAAWVQLARAREALGRGEPAKEAARRAVETLGAGDSRAAYEARAVEARLAGHPERAQELLAQLLARFPDDVEARVELAEAYGEQGSLDRAIAALEAVVRLAPHHPRAWFLLGKYSIVAGNARRAVDELLVQALVVQNELGSDQGRAEVRNAIGVGYHRLGEIDRAFENYELAAALRKKIGDERGYAMSLRNLGTLHTLRGEYGAAEAKYKESLVLFTRLGNQSGIADVENDFGVLAEQRGNYEETLAHYQRALRARRDLGNDIALAQSFGNVGFAYSLLGRYDDALVYYRQGLDLAKRSADPSAVVRATQNLGQLELARGQWDEAVRSFLTALRTSRELGMKETIVVSLTFLGRLAQYQGRPGAALASYGEVLPVQREIHDLRGLAEITLAMAETELELGMTESAGKRLQEADELLRSGDNREQQAELSRLRGEALLARGERGAAAVALRRAVTEAAASHGVVELLSARLSAAALSGRANGLADLERLRAEADTLGNARLRLRAAEAVAAAALATGDARRAEVAARAALEQAAACGSYAGAYRLHRLLAAALERDADVSHRAEAIVERRRVAEEIARVSRDLSPEQRQFFDRLTEVGHGKEHGGDGGPPIIRSQPPGRHG